MFISFNHYAVVYQVLCQVLQINCEQNTCSCMCGNCPVKLKLVFKTVTGPKHNEFYLKAVFVKTIQWFLFPECSI